MGSGSIFKRRFKVFTLAMVIYLDYKATQNKVKWAKKDKQSIIWEKTHERNAKRLLNLIIELEGLWVKLGQYLSTRADVLPIQYINLLRQLQDSLPPRPLLEVTKTIEKSFGNMLLDKRILRYIIPVFSFVLLYSKLPHKELRFIIGSLPLFNVSAAIASTRVYNNRRKNVWKLLYLMMLGSFLVSLGCSIIAFMASYNNYPAGYALKTLHEIGKHSADQSDKWVHIDSFAAINGISRFCAREVASKSGLVSIALNLLSQWVPVSCDTEKLSVPRWVISSFLAIDLMLQLDSKLSSEVIPEKMKSDNLTHQTPSPTEGIKKNELPISFGLTTSILEPNDKKCLLRFPANV